jgi:hypothetical protein
MTGLSPMTERYCIAEHGSELSWRTSTDRQRRFVGQWLS